MLNPFRRKPPAAVGLKLFDLADLHQRPRAQNEAVIRALCSNAYLGAGTSLCRVLGRYKMFVDTRDRGLSSHLVLDGYWEMWVTEALAGIVRPGMTAVDVGANLGYFTVLMAELVGERGRVHAFEPNDALAARLRQSADVNGFWYIVEVHGQALGDDEGAYRFIVPEGEPKNGYLVAADDNNADLGPTLTTRRLDSFEALADADVVKIDADTSEQAIWRGMSGILSRGRPMTIFLEFAATRYPDPAGFLDEIASFGFTADYLSIDSGLKKATRADILALPAAEDQMLVLRRG